MPLRVAHVISSPEGIGGAERVLGDLVAHGRDAGVEQLVLQPFLRDDAVARIVGDRARFAGRPGEHIFQVAGMRRWVDRALDEFRPDVVHAHLFHAGAIVATLPRRAPRVLTQHHAASLEVTGAWWERRADSVVTRRFDHVVAVSQAVRAFLIDHYGCPPEQLSVIRNGWSGAPLASTPVAGRILSIGNLRPEKGHDVLLRALARARVGAPAAHLVLVGDGPERTRLERLASELGVEGQTTFLGSVEDVWPLLAEATVAAMPSLAEQLGIAAIEASAAGVPVVASDVGGLPEVVIDRRTGILVPPGDHECLARALAGLVLDPVEARRLGANGQEEAAAWTADVMAGHYLSLYRRLSGGS